MDNNVAYMRYLDVLHGVSGGGERGGLRVATLAEWMGDGRCTRCMVFSEPYSGAVLDSSMVLGGDGTLPVDGGSGSPFVGRREEVGTNNRRSDHESSCQAACGSTVEPVGNDGALRTAVVSRGKNWASNQAKKRRNKSRGKGVLSSSASGEVVDEKGATVPEWRRKGTGVHHGAFSSCTSEVQQELRDTRAKMLVERNKTALVRAEVERRKMEANLSSRTYELQVEAERLRLDAAREKVIADKLAKLPAGYAETVASEGLTSCVPSLSDGSVSPNSSISVAEVHRMMKSIADLTVRVAELTAQNQEDYVKKQAVIVQKDEELRALEKKLAISDMKNRTNFGGEWASSSYDDDY